jgi:hypothetical protein
MFTKPVPDLSISSSPEKQLSKKAVSAMTPLFCLSKTLLTVALSGAPPLQ